MTINFRFDIPVEPSNAGLGRHSMNCFGRLLAVLSVLLIAACGGAVPPVTGPVLSIDRLAVSQTALTTDAAQSVRITLTVNNPVPGLVIFLNRSTFGLENVEFIPSTDVTAYLDLTFKAGASLVAGTYTDTVEVKICRENPCVRQISGSPQTITTAYVIRPPGAQPEPGVTPLTTVSRNALAHNVIDAEFSKALNAVVMVSNWPSNALYVYDAANSTEKKVLLNKAPTAVSVSPDGKTAAVGHDAMISHIDLNAVGQITGITELNVSAVVGDLVLDGNGYVHAFSENNQSVNVRTVNVASNTETLGPPSTYAGTLAKLHPGGSRLYAADNGLSPNDIWTYDISRGPISTRPVDSPYHGEYDMCGNLWLKEDGSTIYTACGNTFLASETPSLDMRYAGRIALSPKAVVYDEYEIRSLSQSAAAVEIALIEQLSYSCRASAETPNNCYSHLALYDDKYMNRSKVFSIPPVVTDNYAYPQRGLFVFHRNDNAKILITRVMGVSDQSKEYYLSISN